MKVHGKIATESFLNGFNCAQAIVSAFGPGMGISRDLTLKMTMGLGAGGNYNGKICGAVLGAYIILGLKYGSDIPNDKEQKELVRTKLNSFTARFRKRFGSIECNELLQADISDPVALQRLRDEHVFQNFCKNLVHDAAVLVEEILSDEE